VEPANSKSKSKWIHVKGVDGIAEELTLCMDERKGAALDYIYIICDNRNKDRGQPAFRPMKEGC
jgi:hypothetical protein